VPDIMTPLRSIAKSLEKTSGREQEVADSVTEPRDHA
jgi:hypothetical protein